MPPRVLPRHLPAAWFRRSLILATALVGLAAPAWATDESSLRIGVAADAPPLAFLDEGVLRGLEIDLAQALTSALSRELQLLELPRPRLIDALRGGRVDLVFATLDAAELAALRLQASAPLLATGQMALVRSEDLHRFPRNLDVLLTSDRVGYERGTRGARLVQDAMPNAERVPLAGASAGIAALRRGGIQLFIHDAPTVWTFAADPAEQELAGIFRPLTSEHLAWVMRAEDALLRRQVNQVIAQWRQSGRLAVLFNRWLPVQVEVTR